MNADLLRGWLGLTDAWPPKSHVLLGIEPSERDLARIEHQVQERLSKLRCYQLSHPEEATEGMNRLAQAFVEMMDGGAKPAVVSQETPMPPSDADTAVDRPTRLDWQAAPPPVRRSEAKAPPTMVASAVSTPLATVARNGVPKALPAPNAAANTQMILHLAQDSPAARAGLCTVESVVRRVDETRRLLTAWNELGRWLRDPKRRPTKLVDDQDLTRRFDAVRDALESYPAIIGQPGTPGYRVAATARLSLSSLFVRGMDASHRQLLSLDWMQGRKVLLAYRSYLVKRFQTMRRRGPVGATLHFVGWFARQHPWILATATLIALGAVAVAIWM